jgi:hypothetical protein
MTEVTNLYGNMIEIRKSNFEDNLRLIPFLKEFNIYIPDENWQNLLNYGWEGKFPYNGILLEINSEIVGFLSYIISTGFNNGSEILYCNLSSWIVNVEYRSQSVKLLSEAFEIRKVIILNLSPHEKTRPLFKALKFEILSEYEYRINPIKLNYSFLFKKKTTIITCKELTEENVTNSKFSKEINKMLNDHLPYKNVHFYHFTIKNNGIINELILAFNQKKLKTENFLYFIKEIPYKLMGKTNQAELLYSNSSEILTKYFSEIFAVYINKIKIRNINVSEHFVNNKYILTKYMVKNKKDCPWFYYSDVVVQPNEIHLLYSEKVILNF